MTILLPITSIVAAILAILLFVLTLLVSLRRAALGKSAGDIAKYVFGDGDDEILRRRGRAFGNLIEYAPICVIMIALLEGQGASATLLLWLGGAFIIGRIVHAISMLFIPRNPLPRGLAMMTTYLVLLISAGKILFSMI
jgi:uncharacterized membrane protein YecN with MAPEG domain